MTSGQFCSTAHRKAYWQEQERLAVERLHQTHDSLRAYRPAAPLEPVPQRVPQMAAWSPAVKETPRQPVADFEYTPAVDERARTASNTGQVKFAGFITLKPRAQAATAIKAEPFVTDLAFAAHAVPALAVRSLHARLVESAWETAPGTPIPFFRAAALAPASAIDLAFATHAIPAVVLPSLRARLVESAWETAPGTPIPFSRATVLAPASRPGLLRSEPDRLLPGSGAGIASLLIPFEGRRRPRNSTRSSRWPPRWLKQR